MRHTTNPLLNLRGESIPPSLSGSAFHGKKGLGNTLSVASSPQRTPLHNPHYDFQDGLLEKGARYFAALACQRLGGAGVPR
jgi:hypothetical protein